MIEDVKRADGEPFDDMTVVAGRMIETLPEGREIFAIAIVREGKAGGMCMYGFTDDSDAILMLLGNLEALLKTRGKSLHVVPIADTGNADLN